MIEKAKQAAEALRMFERCFTELTPCGECVQVEYEGRVACNRKPETYASMAVLFENMAAELEQVKRERDAAIEALTLWPCFTCDNVHKPVCLGCIRNRVRILDMRGQFMRDSYVWRGLRKESGGADHED